MQYEEWHTTLCSSSKHLPHRANVTFVSQLGRVPLLSVRDQDVQGWPARVSIARMQAGSTEALLECAGLGDCDFDTGRCRCWDHQGTSDGVGGQGDNGDCGSFMY